jgi:hypothetical protein
MQAATGNPEHLRRMFHQEIDRMEPARLEILNRMLQQLRIFELSDQVDKGFDADSTAGRLLLDKVAEAIRAVRREHPYA